MTATVQDIENGSVGSGSTATMQMKAMFVLAVASFALAVVACIQNFGGYTPEPIMGVELPSISLFSAGIKGIITVVISISVLPPGLGAAVIFFTHAFPSKVLFGSKQMTNEIRSRQSKPFQLKYLNALLGGLNVAAGVLGAMLGFGLWTPALMNMIAGGLMLLNVPLTFMHFAQPGVPQSLSLEYGAGGGGGGGAPPGKIAELEKKIESLESRLAKLEAKA